MRTAGPRFEVITSPQTVATLPRPSRLFVALAVAIGLGLGAAIVAQRTLAADASTRDRQALDQAERIFDRLVAERRAWAMSEAAVLAGDTRVRAPVMAPTFDETTARDVLGDLQASAGASWLAILDPAGKVRAVAGASALRGLDFGSSPVVRAAADHAGADIWTLPDRALVVGVAPVRTADQATALLAIGFEIGPSLLAAVADVSGAQGGVLVGDRLVASSAADESVRTALLSAARDERAPDGTSARVATVGRSATGKVAWLVRPTDGWSATHLVPWSLVPLVALGFILGALARRGATPPAPASERRG